MTCCALIAIALLLAEDKPVGDAAKLKGTWKVVATMFDGKKSPSKSLAGRQIVFSDKEFTAMIGQRKGNVVAFTLDESKKPKQIDLKRKGLDSLAKGIYELAGNRLMLCYGEPNAERPKKFASAAGSRVFLIVLERVKK